MKSNKKLTGFLIFLLVSIVTILGYRSLISIASTRKLSTMSDLQGYIITLKESCPDAEASSIKSKVGELGGKVTNEFTLIKAFSVELPAIHVESLPKDFSGIATIEEDKEVHINK
ncbi:Protease B inhibitor 2 [Candida viswanathii]|uniref:Protease B inhibitor 2 n=1 Tax=Candida viswanathii TaxID=5486 RepID=A0A367Y193_9ASCO|nr:Protease B inhibitor 2 [Candida viswanathii]RCK59262.1 Protease B inhibitor 2 [Candida viswanathii]